MLRAENVAAARASYGSVLVGGAAGGSGGTVTGRTGGGGRGARAGPGRPGSMGAQSSFKLQQFLCSGGYAMDNLDEAQRIHPS